LNDDIDTHFVKYWRDRQNDDLMPECTRIFLKEYPTVDNLPHHVSTRKDQIRWNDNEHVVMDMLMYKYTKVLTSCAPSGREGVKRNSIREILSWKQFVQLFIDLKGKCGYGEFYIQFDKERPEWHLSPERLDNDKTYLNGNVTLTCELFNTRAQWSKEKVRIVVEAIMSKIAKRQQQQ
jgi:hypothetical protein